MLPRKHILYTSLPSPMGVNILHLKRERLRKQPWIHRVAYAWVLSYFSADIQINSCHLCRNLVLIQWFEWCRALIDGHNIFVSNDMQFFQEIMSQVFILKARKAWKNFFVNKILKDSENDISFSFVLVDDSSGISLIIFMIPYGYCQICLIK